MIDKTTGDGVFIGELNSTVSGLPYHGLDFDPVTQTMFMVSFNAFTFDNELWTVDLATGANTLVGSVGLWTGTIAVVPMESLMASFSSDMTMICPDDSIYYFDTSTGGPAIWSWTFEGGTPETSNEQNPVVVYDFSGEYDVTLEVSDETNINTIFVENYITVSETPEPEISGLIEPCQFDVETYFTGNNPGNTYEWIVTGGNIVNGAGTNEISVEWTNFGLGLITLTEGNEFCASTTEPFEVNILVCDAIGELSSHSNWLYPNPALDEIRLKLTGLNAINLKIIDSNGIEILHQTVQNQIQDHQVINISSLPEGFYFLLVSTMEGKVYSGKFVKIE